MLDHQFSIHVITTSNRIDRSAVSVDSLSRGTNLNKNELFVVLNEHWNPNSPIINIVQNKARVIHFKRPIGLAPAWNRCVENSNNDWVVLCNDDIAVAPYRGVFKKHWTESLKYLISNNPTFPVFLLCHPNGFSGFAINKMFWEKMEGFRDEFPAGYYEDCDFFLRVAKKFNFHTKKELMNHIFYSVFERHSESLFYHIPESFPKTVAWDRNANKEVFDKYWEEVGGPQYGAYENKNGKFYLPRKFK